MEDIAVVGEPADATAEQLVEFWRDQHAMIVKRYQMNNSHWTERNKTLIERHSADVHAIGFALLCVKVYRCNSFLRIKLFNQSHFLGFKSLRNFCIG